MKKELGLNMIGVVIVICIIIAVVAITILKVKNNINTEDVKEIKANMLLIQGAAKVAKQNSVAKKTEETLVGTKLNQIENDEIIANFKALNVIEESQHEKYYMLNNDDLAKLNIKVWNEEGAYYLVNYDDNEVIITTGIGGKYKLSDIEKEEAQSQDNGTEQQNNN